MVIRQYGTISVDYEHRLHVGFSRFILFQILEATPYGSGARRPTSEQRRPARVGQRGRGRKWKKGKRVFGIDNNNKKKKRTVNRNGRSRGWPAAGNRPL